jgi:hypothetical protein
VEVLDDELLGFDRIDVADDGVEKISLQPDPPKFRMAEIIKVSMGIDDWNLLRHVENPFVFRYWKFCSYSGNRELASIAPSPLSYSQILQRRSPHENSES